MNMLLYYSVHSIKNQIKKLFKTWVLIFLLVCFGMGFLIGGVANLFVSNEKEEEIVLEESQIVEEGQVEELDLSDPISNISKRTEVLELAAGGIILFMLLMGSLTADKSGSSVFLPADVNLLFPSPMKPQSVLLFRMASQLGLLIFVTLYMMVEIPVLIESFALQSWSAIMIVSAWGFTLVISKLWEVFLFTVGTTFERIKSKIRPTVYLFMGLLTVSFLFFWKKSGLSAYHAAIGFFNAPASRWIPIWGWIKGMVGYAIEGNLVKAMSVFILLLIFVIVMIFVIWNIKADFYEDALAKSEEMAQILANMQEGNKILKKRKKDRAETLLRDGMKHGNGANVFFYKSMYNRFRFSHFRILTKTSETYLVVASLISLLFSYQREQGGLLVVALVLAVFAFYRAMGNPLEPDVDSIYFRMLPEDTWVKLFWSLLGGSVNCFLDLLPAMLVAVVLLRANPISAFLWILFIVTLDFYSTMVGTFIAESVPVSAGKTVKQIVQIMFIYFGLIPDIIVIALGYSSFIFLPLSAALIIAAVMNVIIGSIFYVLIPVFLHS